MAPRSQPAFVSSSLPQSSSSATFLLVPAPPKTPQQLHAQHRPKPSFSISFPPPTSPIRSPTMQKQPAPLMVEFKAPAHKHAHHLHSIPPKEKTAKTLIIDHMLWLHSRARFTQARSELGLSQDTSATPEPVSALAFGLDRHQREKLDNVTPFIPQIDLVLAKSQKAAAEGMEKVLSSMLDVPSHGLNDDVSKPLLPNGVRFRLALSALVNDFFAREEDVFQQPSTISPSPSAMSISSIVSNGPAPEPPIPVALEPLARISKYSTNSSGKIHGDDPPRPPPPPTSIFSAIPRGAGPESPWAYSSQHEAQLEHSLPSFAHFLETGRSSSAGHSKENYSRPKVLKAVGRSRVMYNTGIVAPGRESDNALRCARHLLDPKDCHGPCHGASGMSTSPIGNRSIRNKHQSNIGAGLSKPGPPLRRPLDHAIPLKSTKGNNASPGTTRMVDLLPRFLRLSALVARELGREVRGEEGSDGGVLVFDTVEEDVANLTEEDAHPSKEWYALLSGIVTRAVLEGYLARGWKGADGLEVLFGLGVGLDWAGIVGADETSKLSSNGADRDDSMTGYDADGDTEDDRMSDIGEDIGEETDSDVDQGDDLPDESIFAPDAMPSLVESGKILFSSQPTYPTTPSLPTNGRRTSAFSSTGTGNALPVAAGDPEWEREMAERVSEFSSVSPHATNLIDHLQDLALRYPPEPVERAALRFCEAVASWRGTPELENYKAKAQAQAQAQARAAQQGQQQQQSPQRPPSPMVPPEPHRPSSSSSSISISSLINPIPDVPYSPPAAPKPTRHPIQTFFVLPPRRHLNPRRHAHKRSRDGTEQQVDDRPNKSPRREMVGAEWTGPYGL